MDKNTLENPPPPSLQVITGGLNDEYILSDPVDPLATEAQRIPTKIELQELLAGWKTENPLMDEKNQLKDFINHLESENVGEDLDATSFIKKEEPAWDDDLEEKTDLKPILKNDSELINLEKEGVIVRNLVRPKRSTSAAIIAKNEEIVLDGCNNDIPLTKNSENDTESSIGIVPEKGVIVKNLVRPKRSTSTASAQNEDIVLDGCNSNIPLAKNSENDSESSIFIVPGKGVIVRNLVRPSSTSTTSFDNEDIVLDGSNNNIPLEKNSENMEIDVHVISDGDDREGNASPVPCEQPVATRTLRSSSSAQVVKINPHHPKIVEYEYSRGIYYPNDLNKTSQSKSNTFSENCLSTQKPTSIQNKPIRSFPSSAPSRGSRPLARTQKDISNSSHSKPANNHQIHGNLRLEQTKICELAHRQYLDMLNSSYSKPSKQGRITKYTESMNSSISSPEISETSNKANDVGSRHGSVNITGKINYGHTTNNSHNLFNKMNCILNKQTCRKQNENIKASEFTNPTLPNIQRCQDTMSQQKNYNGPKTDAFIMNKDDGPSSSYLKRFPCEHCGKAFSRNNSLKRHLPIHSETKSYVCRHCCVAFSTHAGLICHEQTVHSTENIKCDVCSRVYKNVNSLRVHIRNAHKKVITATSINPIRITHKNAITEQNKPAACGLCSKMFINEQKMKQHCRRTHGKGLEFICNDCSASFRTKDKLRIHISVNHMPPTVPCHKCSKLFLTITKLSTHLRLEHLIDSRRSYICEVCGKVTKGKEAHEIHLSIHTNEKPFICEECGKGFKTKLCLQQHSLMHSDIRPYSCDLCEMSFKRRHHLRQHMAVHGMVSTPRYGKRGKQRRRRISSDSDSGSENTSSDSSTDN